MSAANSAVIDRTSSGQPPQPRLNIEYVEYLSPKPVPPSIDPGVLSTPAGFETDAMVVSVREALKAGKTAAEKSREVAVALLNDESKTEVGRHKEAAAAIYSASRAAMERIQSTIDRVTEKVNAMEETLRGPAAPKDAVGHFSQMEIRNMLSNMTREKRRETILASIRAGDQATLGAVLRCPSYLIGMDETEQADYRLRWQQVVHPQEAAQLAVLKDAAVHLERGGRLLLDYSLSLTSPVLVKRAKQAQERAAAALA